jgi:hypothetical protein
MRELTVFEPETENVYILSIIHDESNFTHLFFTDLFFGLSLHFSLILCEEDKKKKNPGRRRK